MQECFLKPNDPSYSLAAITTAIVLKEARADLSLSLADIKHLPQCMSYGSELIQLHYNYYEGFSSVSLTAKRTIQLF